MRGDLTGAPSMVTGHVLTMDPSRPRAEALGIKDGRVVAVGSRAEVTAAVGANAEHHDFGTATIIPGLIDSHNHMLWTAMQRRLVDLTECRSVDEIVAQVKAFADTHPDLQWIVSGAGWHVESLRERRYPTRQELDSACPDRPVYLPRVGHAAVANTAALKRAGIDRNTPEPEGGRIVRDSAGDPTGVLLEPPAFNPVGDLVPPMALADRAEALVEMQALYNAAGITGVIDPGLTADEMSVYQSLWARDALTVRTVAMPLAQIDDDPERMLAKIRTWGPRTRFGDAWLKLGGIKLFLDGGASLNTALMREPYPDESCQCGIQVTHSTTFHRLAELCAETGWSLGVHAVGGKAIDIALEVFADVHERHPINDLRFSLIHAYLWPTKENMETARRLDVGVATQAAMQYQFAPLLTRRFGKDMMGAATPVKSWLDGGVIVGGGSDSPITPYQPLLGMWHAVTRYVDDLGEVVGAEEAVTPEQALAMYTTGAAWLAFSEHEKGRLSPGFLGDWVALSDDPTTIDPMAIRDIDVLATAVGGRIVHGGPR
ncbi:MAG: amidohydrolase [Aquisalimonadaceae bacterium]